MAGLSHRRDEELIFETGHIETCELFGGDR
jgi:hypothetical protein